MILKLVADTFYQIKRRLSNQKMKSTLIKEMVPVLAVIKITSKPNSRKLLKIYRLEFVLKEKFQRNKSVDTNKERKAPAETA